MLSAARAQSVDTYEAALRDGIAARDRARDTLDPADWELAYAHLRRAVVAQATAEAHFELAEVAAQMRLTDVAYEHYERGIARGLTGRAAARAQLFLRAHATNVAHVVLEASATMRLYVNGRERPAALLEGRPIAVPVGSVALRVEQPGCHAWTTHLWTRPGESVRLRARPIPKVTTQAAIRVDDPSSPAWASVVGWSGGALLVTGGGTLLATSVLLSAAQGDLDDHCGVFDGERCAAATPENREPAQAAADRVETLQAVRRIAVATTLLGVTGIVVGWAAPRLLAAPAVSAELTLAPGHAGISCRGWF